MGIYPKDSTFYYRDTYSSMFIAALFIMGRTWDQSRHPSTDEWIGKVWYLHIMYFYLVINKNEIMKSGGWYDGSG